MTQPRIISSLEELADITVVPVGGLIHDLGEDHVWMRLAEDNWTCMCLLQAPEDTDDIELMDVPWSTQEVWEDSYDKTLALGPAKNCSTLPDAA